MSSTLTPACCITQPVAAAYTTSGTKHTDDATGMEYYLVGDSSAKQGILFCYDVFGFHPNALQVADILANSGPGFRVIMPDHLGDQPLAMEDMVNKTESYQDFIQRRSTYPYNKARMLRAIELLNCEKVGGVGFCWGAKLVMGALADMPNSNVLSGSLIHPSMVTLEDFENAQGPTLILLSKDEREMEQEFEVAKTKTFGQHTAMTRFGKQKHGFCAATLH